MLLKILLVIGIIAAVYFLFFKKPAITAASKEANKPKNADDEMMVPCETCGVFVSVKEAFIKDGRYFCSKACMEEH